MTLIPNLLFRLVMWATSVQGQQCFAGNEAVLQARFEDAQFFYNSDLKQPLDAYVPRLEGTQFHKHLGNLLQKTKRVERLIGPVAEACGLAGQRLVKRQYIFQMPFATLLNIDMFSVCQMICQC